MWSASNSSFKRYIITLSANNSNFVFSFPAILLISVACLLTADITHRTALWSHGDSLQLCPPDSDGNCSAVSTWRKTRALHLRCFVLSSLLFLSLVLWLWQHTWQQANLKAGSSGERLAAGTCAAPQVASAARKQDKPYSCAQLTSHSWFAPGPTSPWNGATHSQSGFLPQLA